MEAGGGYGRGVDGSAFDGGRDKWGGLRADRVGRDTRPWRERGGDIRIGERRRRSGAKMAREFSRVQNSGDAGGKKLLGSFLLHT